MSATPEPVCVVCEEGTMHPRSFYKANEYLGQQCIVRMLLHTCDACECDIGLDNDLSINKHAMISLHGAVRSFQADPKNKALDLRCYSCKTFVMIEDVRYNDGHCPACQCEIDLDEDGDDEDE